MREAEEDHFARRVATRFAALFEQRFKDYPSMGGKNVAVFARRLERTGKLRNVDPLQLLDLAFDRWTQKPLDAIAKRAPYACFIAHFGELIDAPAAAANEQTRLLEQQDEALRKGDRALYTKLVDEFRSKFGGEDGQQPSV
ncbi:MAG TPA: hypothetical protein VK524_06320 [Polyangiaceae bacterium]|nr:hypothetical protein [Polyangiaceae bacterium]